MIAKTRTQIAETVLSTVSEQFGMAQVDESMTWKQAGWCNDSLDETDFLLTLEQRLGIEVTAAPPLLTTFYDVDRPISIFIDFAFSLLTANPEHLNTNKGTPR
ncbi:MAG: hypothetical protein H0X38_07520 [Planctomycetes bacterium]|nr:hypothetical protein [Planctomycetota bacterium]